MKKKTLVLSVASLLLLTLSMAIWRFELGFSVKKAPNSDFLFIDATRLNMQDLKGNVVLVNFWATSCSTCVAEMPKMIETHQKYHAKGYQEVAVAMSYDRPEYVVNFAQTRRLPFKVAIDSTGIIAKEWGDVLLTPTTFLINKKGEIVKRYVGSPDFDQLHKEIERHLKS